jgi:cyclopropane fatty-acyl-phospholipid synthase-like methyltransferase
LRESFTWRYSEGQDVWTNETALSKVAAIAVNEMVQNSSVQILDIGIGNGAHVKEILEDENRTLTGLDIVTPPAWPELKQKYQDRISLIEGDFMSWGEDEPSAVASSFDLILDMGCFHHQLPEVHKNYLLKARRLLSPGGTFVLCVYGINGESDDSRKQEQTDHKRLAFYYSTDGIEEQLNSCGFEVSSIATVMRPELDEHYLVAISKLGGNS